jgi:hypothetical protein
MSQLGQIQKSECATGSPLCTQRTDILGRASCPKNANLAARRSGLQVELRDVQTALATLREASGNGPRNDLGIIAGEPFERRQYAHDLTRAYQVHLCNNGRFDRHFHSSRTAERINSNAARGISGMRLRSRNDVFCGPTALLTHVSPPPFAPTTGAPACRRAARSPPPHPAQDPPGSVPRSAARRSVGPGAAIRGQPRRVGPAR